MNRFKQLAWVHMAVFGSLLWPAPATGAGVVKDIFSGSAATYIITVLADGYAGNEQLKFDTDANFLMVSQLVNSDFYQSHQSVFKIRTVFQASPASGTSQFGISVNGGVNNCHISTTTPQTQDSIIAALGSLAMQNLIVLANDDTKVFGCSIPAFLTYITSGANGGIVRHEFGHLIAGLFDEYDDGRTAYTGTPTNDRNCSTATPPWWMSLAIPSGVAAPGAIAGCNKAVSGIKRAYSTCRMRDSLQLFCFVCTNRMIASLYESSEAPVPTAPTSLRIKGVRYQPAPSSSPGRSVRLLIQIDRRTWTTQILAATDVAGPALKRQQRTGDYVYEITENGQPVTTSVFAGDPFEVRGYSGKATPHTSATADVADVFVYVPDATVQEVLARPLQITFYQLTASDPDAVTPAKLARLKAQGQARSLAVLTPTVLKDQLAALANRRPV